MQTETQNGQVRLNSKPDFLPSLNGGRAIAALMVFCGHFLAMQFATPVGQAAVYDAHATGRGATDEFMFKVFSWFVPVPINYFFVLSGFVLAWIYRPGQTASGFWLKRLGKVYPAYFITTVIAFVLWGVLGGMWTNWKIVTTHAFLLQGWTPDQTYLMGLNVVMWTLSNEVFLYLLFPGLILMLTQFTKRGLQITAVACIALSFLLPQLAGRTLTVLDPKVQAPLEGFDNAFIYWFTLMFPPIRMFQFVLGICLALLMHKGIKYVTNVPVAIVIFTVGLTLTNLYLPVEMRNLSGMMIPIAFLITAIAKSDLNGRRSLLKTRPMLFFGKISYSFYAVHILFILFTILHKPSATGAWDYPRLWLYEAGFLDKATDAVPGWLNIGLFLLYFAVTTLAAWLIYRFIEIPIANLVRRKVNKMEKKRSAAPAEVKAEPETVQPAPAVSAAST